VTADRPSAVPAHNGRVRYWHALAAAAAVTVVVTGCGQRYLPAPLSSPSGTASQPAASPASAAPPSAAPAASPAPSASGLTGAQVTAACQRLGGRIVTNEGGVVGGAEPGGASQPTDIGGWASCRFRLITTDVIPENVYAGISMDPAASGEPAGSAWCTNGVQAISSRHRGIAARSSAPSPSCSPRPGAATRR
jgi:hypothetical protein